MMSSGTTRLYIEFTIKFGDKTVEYGYPKKAVQIVHSGNLKRWRLNCMWGNKGKDLNFIGWKKLKSTGKGDINFVPVTSTTSRNQIPDLKPWIADTDDNKRVANKFAGCLGDSIPSIEIHAINTQNAEYQHYRTILEYTGLKSDNYYLATAYEKCKNRNAKNIISGYAAVLKNVDLYNIHAIALRKDYLSYDKSTEKFRSKVKTRRLLYNLKIEDGFVRRWGGWKKHQSSANGVSFTELAEHFGIAKLSIFEYVFVQGYILCARIITFVVCFCLYCVE